MSLSISLPSMAYADKNTDFLPIIILILQEIVRRSVDGTVVPIFVSYGNQQVGIGTSTPDASAILDIVSTSSGFGVPSMTSAQRNNISAPRAGLMVYDSTIAQFMGYNGTNWVILG